MNFFLIGQPNVGKSSIYNRLSIGDIRVMIPMYYTDGWGHFHFSNDIEFQSFA